MHYRYNPLQVTPVQVDRLREYNSLTRFSLGRPGIRRRNILFCAYTGLILNKSRSAIPDPSDAWQGVVFAAWKYGSGEEPLVMKVVSSASQSGCGTGRIQELHGGFCFSWTLVQKRDVCLRSSVCCTGLQHSSVHGHIQVVCDECWSFIAFRLS